jgi:hypothetical protein
MTVRELKHLVASLPDDAAVLVWDKDTANSIAKVIAFNVELPQVQGIEAARGDATCVRDCEPAPGSALILVSNE